MASAKPAVEGTLAGEAPKAAGRTALSRALCQSVSPRVLHRSTPAVSTVSKILCVQGHKAELAAAVEFGSNVCAKAFHNYTSKQISPKCRVLQDG